MEHWFGFGFAIFRAFASYASQEEPSPKKHWQIIITGAGHGTSALPQQSNRTFVHVSFLGFLGILLMKSISLCILVPLEQCNQQLTCLIKILHVKYIYDDK